MFRTQRRSHSILRPRGSAPVRRKQGGGLWPRRAAVSFCSSLVHRVGRRLAPHAQGITAVMHAMPAAVARPVVAHAVSPMAVLAARIALTPAMAVARAD